MRKILSLWQSSLRTGFPNPINWGSNSINLKLNHADLPCWKLWLLCTFRAAKMFRTLNFPFSLSYLSNHYLSVGKRLFICLVIKKSLPVVIHVKRLMYTLHTPAVFNTSFFLASCLWPAQMQREMPHWGVPSMPIDGGEYQIIISPPLSIVNLLIEDEVMSVWTKE